MTRHRRVLALALALGLGMSPWLATGCDAAPSTAGPQATWHGGVSAMFETRCAGCHRSGGIGPFALDTYDDARTWAAAAVGAIAGGRMPPWPPDPECRPLHAERRVTPDELQRLRDWIDAGHPLGDPKHAYVATTAATHGLGAADLVLSPNGPYASPDDVADDYHCFVLDHAFEADAWIRMLEVDPGQDATVHHVILFRVPAEGVAEVEARDFAEPGEGYTCFGAPGGGVPDTLGGWLPGTVVDPYPHGVAMPVPAGSRIVMQVHYNLSVTREPDPGTSVKLWLADEPPVLSVDVVLLADPSIVIPPGEPASQHISTHVNTTDTPWVVFGVSAHMHLLGTGIRMDALHSDGTEACLLDIPEWAFEWQQPYAFRPGDLAIIAPGEQVRLTCGYNNSAANQPVVGGEQRTPVTVTWGDGTYDEMCLGHLVLLRPNPNGGLRPAP